MTAEQLAQRLEWELTLLDFTLATPCKTCRKLGGAEDFPCHEDPCTPLVLVERMEVPQ